MVEFDAVLFDWMLTLAHYPSPREHLGAAMADLGRDVVDDELHEIVQRLEVAERQPDVLAALAVADTSVDAHFEAEHLWYERAGIDPTLASAMYDLVGSPRFHPVYPDVGVVLERLVGADVRIGVVSDIHVDLREHAAGFGLGHLVDAWALSFELGVQKPDPRIFESALDQIGCDPARTLMVGDRAAIDGGAAAVGVSCLILPAPDRWMPRGLDRVLRLVGVGTAEP